MMDFFAPAYMCPSPTCSYQDCIIVTSCTDPLCDLCGSVLEEVEVEFTVVDGNEG